MKRKLVIIDLPKGFQTTICLSDKPIISGYHWYAHKRHDSSGYYVAASVTVGGKRRHVMMHRLITGAPPGTQVDHRDGNPLNNHRDNLRICSNSQNQRNRAPKLSNKCGYKGVHWMKPGKKNAGRWRVRIQAGGRRILVGDFTSLKEAATAYNNAAIKLHGDFARLNNA